MTKTEELQPLRCATAGSVDDGKSTLIGRLLVDTKALMTDQLEHVEEASKRRGLARTDLALLTDGLRAEREQGITIDVAWRYFATPRRRFILADSPGHVQYTRNMVTAASAVDAAIILVDARNGVGEQTRRHLFVTRLLGVKSLAIAVNKMDQIGYDRDVFTRIRDEITAYVARLPVPGGPPDLAFFPISALVGDNVVEPSRAMSWYEGPTLLSHLEQMPGEAARTEGPGRFPVQWVIRPQRADMPDYRGYAGRVAGGVLRVGQDVRVWPSGKPSRIERIETYDGPRDEARAGASVTVHLTDDVDVSRGDLIAGVEGAAPRVTKELIADVAWLHETPSRTGGTYLLKQGTRETRAILHHVDYLYDVTTGAALAGDANGQTALGANALARVRVRTAEALALDPYEDLRAIGSFILIDVSSGHTLAAGMIRDAASIRPPPMASEPPAR